MIDRPRVRITDEKLHDRIELFCRENIARSIEEQRRDGFLSEEILTALVQRRPTDKDEFRECVSVEARVNLNNDDVQYIHDIFDIIKQAA